MLKNWIVMLVLILSLGCQPVRAKTFKEGGLRDEDFISAEHFMLQFDWEFDTPQRQARYRIRKDRWHKQNAARW